jgi:hypothetical protein
VNGGGTVGASGFLLQNNPYAIAGALGRLLFGVGIGPILSNVRFQFAASLKNSQALDLIESFNAEYKDISNSYRLGKGYKQNLYPLHSAF